jgi:hypothetical protein
VYGSFRVYLGSSHDAVGEMRQKQDFDEVYSDEERERWEASSNCMRR